MPLYAGELNIRRGAPLAEFPAPLSEVLRAQSEQTRMENPLSSIRRLNQMDTATQGAVIDPGDPLEGRPMVREPVRRIDAATARQRVQDEGLKLTIPDDGISERALDILIKAKRDELRRQDVFSRGPQGIGAGAARLGVALVESLFDPLNIASAFVPIVGPARYAAMLERSASPLARAVTRFQVGALEGAAGAALLEPLIYSAAQAEQLDYTMYDSLANIAFGGLFGGGLHAGGGAIADRVRGSRLRAEASLREELAAAQETARIDAEAARRAQEINVRLETVQQQNMADAMRAAQGLPPESRASADAAKIIDALEARRVELAAIADKPAFQRTAAENVLFKSGDIEALTPELRAIVETPAMRRAVDILKKEPFLRTQEERVFLQSLREGYEPKILNEKSGELAREIERLQLSGENPVRLEAARLELDAANQRLRDLGVNKDTAAMVAARVAPEVRAQALSAAVVQAAEGRGISVDSILRLDPAVRAKERTGAIAETVAAAEQAQQPSAIRSADPQASAKADADAREAKPADLVSAEEELAQSLKAAQDFAAALGERDRVNAELREFDEAIQRADAYAKALKAGAACGVA